VDFQVQILDGFKVAEKQQQQQQKQTIDYLPNKI
jgi:hypothetical protein